MVGCWSIRACPAHRAPSGSFDFVNGELAMGKRLRADSGHLKTEFAGLRRPSTAPRTQSCDLCAVPELGEIHQGEAAVVASIVENGPRTAAEISDDLWPGGMTVSRRTGRPALKRNPARRRTTEAQRPSRTTDPSGKGRPMASGPCCRLGLGGLLRDEPHLRGCLRRQRQFGQPRRLAPWSWGRAPRQPRRSVVPRSRRTGRGGTARTPAVGYRAGSGRRSARGHRARSGLRQSRESAALGEVEHRSSVGGKVGLDAAGGCGRSSAVSTVWRPARRLRGCGRCDGHTRFSARSLRLSSQSQALSLG
jgi:hypothetical protein